MLYFSFLRGFVTKLKFFFSPFISRQNKKITFRFSNDINDDIAQTLRNEAFAEDESNSIAYYVVKHPCGKILFFFSLKCGQLFDHFIKPELLERLKKLSEELEDISDDKSLTPQQKQDVADVMEKIRACKGVTKSDLRKLPQQKLDILEELEKELNDDIARVGKTFSGIELVHFCSNSETDDLWENFKLPQLRGSTILHASLCAMRFLRWKKSVMSFSRILILDRIMCRTH